MHNLMNMQYLASLLFPYPPSWDEHKSSFCDLVYKSYWPVHDGVYIH